MAIERIALWVALFLLVIQGVASVYQASRTSGPKQAGLVTNVALAALAVYGVFVAL
ncbi:hypothetical protein UFOVP1672_82 [uncultured Caudovirales phage]|uniref:Uncharacterized protein n=1 Tax=uncultured Caudovirales phage TaxID=2100421 RepID=A0A6J5SAW9_9CAUD|nr:hypothetical protein UFOVP988_20 [uncultured Caudovirales phage]CAB4210550.1 hypothetical protein UFOVP1425_20 [uncultured Caudovirales phage]CAB4223494.1 hypothetical protein UFOVP1672_82 [uncultured Caudovirales phage]